MKSLKNLQIGIVGAALVLSAAPASATTVTVPGAANPFLAGQPDGTSCCGGDSALSQSPTLALSGALGGKTYTFSATGGAGFQPGTPATSPDGFVGAFSMIPDNGTGISGAMGVNVSGLVGVFIGSGAPVGPAPSQRNDGISFASISPELYQIFWIGDGLTGTGTGSVQEFTAPDGAARLYLGTVDGFGWFNNIGAIQVTFDDGSISATPIPGALPLFVSGLAGLGFLAHRRKRKQAA